MIPENYPINLRNWSLTPSRSRWSDNFADIIGQKNTGNPLFFWVSGSRGDGIRTHDLCVPKIINIAKILEKQDIYRVEIKKSFPIGTLVQAAPLIPPEPGAV